MIRPSRIAVATVVSVAVLGAVRHHTIPTACQLLTATDAALLGGFPVTQDPHNEGPGGCLYNHTGASDLSSDEVEVTVRAYSDNATAHAAFPTWVSPSGKPSSMMAVTPLAGVGGEAVLIHVTPNGIAAINFRSGAVLVKIGVYPVPPDTALARAAKTMISRL